MLLQPYRKQKMKTMRIRIAALAGSLMIALTAFIGLQSTFSARANADDNTYSRYGTWDYISASYLHSQLGGSAYAHCATVGGLGWIAECQWNNPLTYSIWQGGSARVDQAQASFTVGFSSLTGSISAPPGVSVSPSGTSCTETFMSAVGMNYATGKHNGTACKMLSIFGVFATQYSITGQIRVNGTSWAAQTYYIL
jgi:hypothetical protein